MGIGNYNYVGPDKKPCLAACEDQTNLVSVTSSSFPNRETFVRRDEFCLVMEKLKRTCNSVKYEMVKSKFPRLCQSIQEVQNVSLAMNKDICWMKKWNPSLVGLNSTDPRIVELEDQLFIYAKHNLAVVNIYIKEPVVTRILRDQKIPIISFVANTGGLLGLCMGFSLVSLFEIIYYVLSSIVKPKQKPPMQCSSVFSNGKGLNGGVVGREKGPTLDNGSEFAWYTNRFNNRNNVTQTNTSLLHRVVDSTDILEDVIRIQSRERLL